MLKYFLLLDAKSIYVRYQRAEGVIGVSRAADHN